MKHLMIISMLILASVGLVSAGENYYDAVEVSTVAFSSSAVAVGNGSSILIWGVGCASSSVNSYWDIYRGTDAVDLNSAGDANSGGRRIYRVSNFENPQTATSTIAAGDIWFPKPIRANKGASWMFSDRTAPNARLYYQDATK